MAVRLGFYASWYDYYAIDIDWYSPCCIQDLGIPLRMPYLQSIIANGTRFTKAFSPAPVCAPARSAIASGREYDQAGVACNFCNDYNTSIPTFYKLLRDDGGYHVMVTGKDDLTKVANVAVPHAQSDIYMQCHHAISMSLGHPAWS
jgi:arylsulfatase A-like enzyme